MNGSMANQGTLPTGPKNKKKKTKMMMMMMMQEGEEEDEALPLNLPSSEPNVHPASFL